VCVCIELTALISFLNGICFAVVIGSLLLAGLYALFNGLILPGLAERIQDMFGSPGGGGSGGGGGQITVMYFALKKKVFKIASFALYSIPPSVLIIILISIQAGWIAYP